MSKKVKKLNLLCDDNDDAESGSLTINKDYADRYDNWRRLEEMQRLKDKYGDEANEEGDTDSTSSEEVEWTADDEKSFLKTFAALKTKNPKIYNTEEKFFVKKDDASTSKVSSSKEKKDKPMFLKDYERKLITEHGGQISEDEDNAGFEKPKEGGYFAEQERLKKEFKMALGDSEGEESEEDLLTKRVKTEEEQRKEDEDFYDWLKGKGSPVEMDEDIKALRDEWSNNEKLDADEKFLRNYIVNKQYEMEADEDAGIPTYDEIVTVEQNARNSSSTSTTIATKNPTRNSSSNTLVRSRSRCARETKSANSSALPTRSVRSMRKLSERRKSSSSGR
ncbi:hypothetical protein L596_028162 [Steinernema carpocapsae]|uniref:Kri1-like C-terminal domain-containing protein n=1 Tax=Steinernema carpocapsae TaxID=34508 RepID=A0A4U5LXM4_STECR|nr:hypothetical protein L596_028162 [Steinernema carpocapsae]